MELSNNVDARASCCCVPWSKCSMQAYHTQSTNISFVTFSLKDDSKCEVPLTLDKNIKFMTSFLLICHAVIEWSPRMDIAECGCNYVITVEVPGVSTKDIRVEVDDQK